jgi:hypothetical protein
MLCLLVSPTLRAAGSGVDRFVLSSRVQSSTLAAAAEAASAIACALPVLRALCGMSADLRAFVRV